MKLLIFDTETSGLKAGYNVILQLSYQIVDSESWIIEKEVNHYFAWPEDKARVSETAIEVNGLTQEFLAKQTLSDKVEALQEFVEDKDACGMLVAHNLDFDKKFILEECAALGVKYAASGWNSTYDTMKKTTTVCRIPKPWGTGYKYPKLIELADELGVETDDLNLHDSSADVELTRRCFQALVYQEYYEFPQQVDTGIQVKVQAEDEKDVSFCFVDKDGDEWYQDELEDIYGKKTVRTGMKEAMKVFCESTNEENEEIKHTLLMVPQLQDVEVTKKELEEVKASQFYPETFKLKEPDRQEIEKTLMAEAKAKIRSLLFWTNGKNRRAYVDERLDNEYQSQLDTYTEAKTRFEREQAEAEAKFMEHKARKTTILQGLIDSDLDTIKEVLRHSPESEFTLPLSFTINATSATEAEVDLHLPRISDMPKYYGFRMANGNYKIKNFSDKDKREFYAECVMGLAFYAAGLYFNMIPSFETLRIIGTGINEETLQPEPLYTIEIGKDALNTMSKEASSIEAFEAFTHKINMTKTYLLKPIKI